MFSLMIPSFVISHLIYSYENIKKIVLFKIVFSSTFCITGTKYDPGVVAATEGLPHRRSVARPYK